MTSGAEANWTRVCVEGGSVTPEQAQDLRNALKKCKADACARVRLIGFLFAKQHSLAQMERARHVRWLIRNRPDIDIHGFGAIAKFMYPRAHRLVRDAWAYALKNDPADVDVITQYASFLSGDAGAVAIRLYQRAIALDARNQTQWLDRIGHVYQLRLIGAKTRAAKMAYASKSLVSYKKALASTSDSLARFGLTISIVATAAVEAGDLMTAGKAAKSLLRRALQHKNSYQYGNGIHCGHVVLGKIAFAQNRLKTAVSQLMAAGRTPGSPQLNSFGPDFSLAQSLLAIGLRAEVLQYIRMVQRFWRNHDDVIDRWVSKIESRSNPDFRIKF